MVIILISSISFILPTLVLRKSMSKRPSASETNPPNKRAQKPAGFCAARPRSPEPSSASNSTVFVTFGHRNERCGTVQTQT